MAKNIKSAVYGNISGHALHIQRVYYSQKRLDAPQSNTRLAPEEREEVEHLLILCGNNRTACQEDRI